MDWVIQLFQDAGQRQHHVLRDVATLCARIADQLVGLVERPGILEHLGGSEPKAPAGVPLLVGQIVEGRRAVAISTTKLVEGEIQVSGQFI